MVKVTFNKWSLTPIISITIFPTSKLLTQLTSVSESNFWHYSNISKDYFSNSVNSNSPIANILATSEEVKCLLLLAEGASEVPPTLKDERTWID